MHASCLSQLYSSKAAEPILMIHRASNLQATITGISGFEEFNPNETKCPAAGR